MAEVLTDEQLRRVERQARGRQPMGPRGRLEPPNAERPQFRAQPQRRDFAPDRRPRVAPQRFAREREQRERPMPERRQPRPERD